MTHLVTDKPTEHLVQREETELTNACDKSPAKTFTPDGCCVTHCLKKQLNQTIQFCHYFLAPTSHFKPECGQIFHATQLSNFKESVCNIQFCIQIQKWHVDIINAKGMLSFSQMFIVSCLEIIPQN